MPTTAAQIINRVRDLVPDPVYSGGTPQPDADGGLFRASSLYGWLDDGVRLMASRLGWTLTDWTAMAAVANQPVYPVSALWHVVEEAYAKQFRCRVQPQPEADSIYPGREPSAQQNRAYVFRVTDHIDLGFDPPPSAADPATALSGAINASVTTIPLVSVANFLSFGFVLIESELIQYQAISGSSLVACTRGAGGTTAVAHLIATPVTHCSLWVKGTRVPVAISLSTSLVEVPVGWVGLLNTYLLAQCRDSEQEFQRASQLMKEFDAACAGIARTMGGRDPITRQPTAPEPPVQAPMPTPAVAQ